MKGSQSCARLIVINRSRKSEGILGVTAPQFRKKYGQKGFSNGPVVTAMLSMTAFTVKNVLKTVYATDRRAVTSYVDAVQKQGAAACAAPMKKKYAKNGNCRLMSVIAAI